MLAPPELDGPPEGPGESVGGYQLLDGIAPTGATLRHLA